MANAHHSANRPHIAATILQMTSGEDDFIIVPKVFVRVTGSLEAGIMLRKALYWHGTNKKGQPFIKRADGFFYKSDREWCEELCLTRYSVRAAAKRLQDMGIFQVKKLQANGKPTMHYRIDFNVLEQRLVEHLNLKASLSEIEQCHCTESNNEVFEIEQSITKTTTQTTTKKSQSSPTANAFGDTSSTDLSYEGNKETISDRTVPSRQEDDPKNDRSTCRPARRTDKRPSRDATPNLTPEEAAIFNALTKAAQFIYGETTTIQPDEKAYKSIRVLVEARCKPREAFDCFVYNASSNFWLHEASGPMTPKTVEKNLGKWRQMKHPLINDEAPSEIKARCRALLARRRERTEAQQHGFGTDVDAYRKARDSEAQRRAAQAEVERREWESKLLDDDDDTTKASKTTMLLQEVEEEQERLLQLRRQADRKRRTAKINLAGDISEEERNEFEIDMMVRRERAEMYM